MEHRIFVYGTLKKGQDNHHYMGRAKFLGEMTVALPFRMVSLGDMPGLVPSVAESTIAGELYSVDAWSLLELDRFEGHPSFYCRERIRTPRGNAWLYRLSDEWLSGAGAERQLDEVPSGVW